MYNTSRDKSTQITDLFDYSTYGTFIFKTLKVNNRYFVALDAVIVLTFLEKGDVIRDTKKNRGWSDGAKVLDKLSVPGRPTSLDNSRARAYCACSRCG